MATVRLSQSVSYGATTHTNTENVTVEGVNVIEETVPDTSSDKEYTVGIDISSAKIISLIADQALTIKTNDAGSPQETISLVANRPRIWREGDTALFSDDVTKFFVSNASGSDTVLKVIVGTDTP